MLFRFNKAACEIEIFILLLGDNMAASKPPGVKVPQPVPSRKQYQQQQEAITATLHPNPRTFEEAMENNTIYKVWLKKMERDLKDRDDDIKYFQQLHTNLKNKQRSEKKKRDQRQDRIWLLFEGYIATDEQFSELLDLKQKWERNRFQPSTPPTSVEKPTISSENTSSSAVKVDTSVAPISTSSSDISKEKVVSEPVTQPPDVVTTPPELSHPPPTSNTTSDAPTVVNSDDVTVISVVKEEDPIPSVTMSKEALEHIQQELAEARRQATMYKTNARRVDEENKDLREKAATGK
jgi:hypothetical protein